MRIVGVGRWWQQLEKEAKGRVWIGFMMSKMGRYRQWTQGPGRGPRDPKETLNPRIRILL